MKPLTKLATTLLKLSGVFIAFGYISLKAHLAVLGVPWDSPLGVERCLAEAYQLVLAAINPVLSYVPFASVLVAVVALIIGLAPRIKRLAPLRERTESWLKEIRISWKIPALLILITVIVCYPMLLRDVDFALTAQFVGPLTGFSYYYMQGFFSVLILICLLTYGGYGSFGDDFQQLNQTTRIFWRVAVFSVTVLLFFAPVVYGTLWHPMQYPTVRVALKGSQTIQCGVLVFKGDSDVLLWRAASRRGELLTIPNGEIHTLVAGPDSDIRKWIKQAIDTGEAKPDCSELPDPPTEGH